MIYLIRLDKVLLWMLNLSHFRNLRVFNGLHWGGVEVVAAHRVRGIDWDMEHDLKCHIISYYSAIAMRGGR